MIAGEKMLQGDKDCRGRELQVERDFAVGERVQGERVCRGRTMRDCRELENAGETDCRGSEIAE